MTDDDNSNGGREFSISRRKALGGLASIGAATTLGGAATFAQFTDTESQSVTFTAGGIDGTITTNASYLGEQLDGSESEFVANLVEYDGEGAGAELSFLDVKPGDYGSFNFTIEVTNNPAWVASCLGVQSDKDWWNYEPELEADDDGGNLTVNTGPLENSTYSEQASETPDGGTGLNQPGEVAENLYIIPFYDSNETSQFFDNNGPASSTYTGSTVASPAGFWSNAQDISSGLAMSVDDNEYLAPRPLSKVVSNKFESTVTYNANQTTNFQTINAPDGTDLDDGCILLNGSGSANDQDNTQKAAPLEPGTTLNFGFDWHIPYTVGNEMMGDKLEAGIAFTFSQVRGAAGPELQNTYKPANQNQSNSNS
jgi:predicted ribosomally synthesized peptide with SipW-like signal peptide